MTPLTILAEGPADPGFLGSPIFLMLILFVMMYVILIRPQQKQRKEAEARIASLTKGDKVVTIGGLHGVVHHISDRTVTLSVSENVYLKFDKASVRDVTKKTAGGASAEEDAKDDGAKKS